MAAFRPQVEVSGGGYRACVTGLDGSTQVLGEFSDREQAGRVAWRAADQANLTAASERRRSGQRPTPA